MQSDGSFTSQALSLLLSLLLPCAFTSDSGFRNLKDTRESEKRKSGAVGRDEEHKKSPKKCAPATHFCADTLVDNAQQRSQALSLSTTIATMPESSEPLSHTGFSK